MCRLMFIVGAKENQHIQQFMVTANKHLSKGNNDGLGYTAIKEDGGIFSERWLKNEDAFTDPLTEDDTEVANNLGDFIDSESVISPRTQQGVVDFDKVRTVMLHTRFATCSKGMDNVHPFVDDENEVSIVHNGVIQNHKEFEKLNSTCDSEVILTEYKKLEASKDITKLETLSNTLKGYWAVGATAKDEEGNRYLDIFRSNASATLFGLFVRQLGGMVFSTRADIIRETMKDMKWEQHNTIFEVNPYVVVRLNTVDGSVIESYKWENKPIVKQQPKQNGNEFGHWDSEQGKWITYEKPRLVKGNKKETKDNTVIVESEFLYEYDDVYNNMDKHYTFIEPEVYEAKMDENLLELLEEIEEDLTKEENEELNNLPYDMIPDFIQGIIDKRKEA